MEGGLGVVVVAGEVEQEGVDVDEFGEEVDADVDGGSGVALDVVVDGG